MSTYAIGDLQGCLDPLKKLLDKIDFNEATDQLWFVGDLVNRGPQSLESLRFVKSLGDSARSVLGNHDLHLLAVINGFRKTSGKDTLQDILDASDRDELENWLRRLPLLHSDPSLGYIMVHAGLHPSWDLETALHLADEVSTELSGNSYQDFLAVMYGNQPANWNPDLRGIDRLRFAVNGFTRMRYLTPDDTLDFSCTLPPKEAPGPLLPWFEASNRKNRELNIVFGHWSSLGDHRVEGVFPLDSGCVWGNCLTAMELETRKIITVDC